MADEADLAAEIIEEATQRGIEAVRAKALTGPSAIWCECGEVIHWRRRELLPGVRTCVMCAEIAERRAG